MKSIYFISDLHLHESAPKAAEGFIRFLHASASQAEALYILGDFFEIWIGDDAANDFEKNIIAELAKATRQGLPIYCIRGNRDFLLGSQFSQKTGIKMLNDPTVIEIFGKKCLISHGDYLCTDDHAHMKLRKITLNPFAQFLFLALPVFIRSKMADKLRGKSRHHKRSQSMDIMDVNQKTVEEEMRFYDVTRFIHGHTHQGKIVEFLLDQKPATRIVLGDWHERAKILRCTEAGGFSLEILDLQHSFTQK